MQEISFRLLLHNIITMWGPFKEKNKDKKHKNVDFQNTFEARLDTFNLNLWLYIEKTQNYYYSQVTKYSTES